METLNNIYQKYKMNDCGGDKGTLHSYIPIYEKYLEDNRENICLLEIGVYEGHSLKMWQEYFKNSKIIGIDIDLNRFKFSNENLEVYECDATDPQKLMSLFKDIQFDYIIDDGSHSLEHQIKSFEILFPLLKQGGFYFIEDIFNIETSWQAFKNLHENAKIIDLRRQKNRFDDVLVVIQK
jgi:predicted O-methyltransferase YrrM